MKESGKDILLLIGVIIIFFIVMIYSGDTSETAQTEDGLANVSFFTPFEKQPEVEKGRSPTVSFVPKTQSIPKDTKENDITIIEEEIKKVEEELLQVQRELEKIEEFGEKSPYEGKVLLRTASARSTDVSREYVEIRSVSKNTERILLSGWRLKSAITGIGVDIPKAAYLPKPGTLNTELPLALSPGDRAFIISGRSPIGVSFRSNICTGYFVQFQKFTPNVKRQCPDPEEEILHTKYTNIFIDNACMDFVERIPRCKIRTDLPLSLSYECQRSIIDEISYNSCVEKHKNDENFIGSEWHIYLKRNNELWRKKREIINLLDEQGRIVDTIHY